MLYQSKFYFNLISDTISLVASLFLCNSTDSIPTAKLHKKVATISSALFYQRTLNPLNPHACQQQFKSCLSWREEVHLQIFCLPGSQFFPRLRIFLGLPRPRQQTLCVLNYGIVIKDWSDFKSNSCLHPCSFDKFKYYNLYIIFYITEY